MRKTSRWQLRLLCKSHRLNERKTDMKKIILLSIALALTGCVTKNKQVLEKSTVFGFQAVSPGTSDSQIKIQIGLVRNEYWSNPTGTNKIYVGQYSSHVNANLTAIHQIADEDFSTLPQSVITDTNGVSSDVTQ